jgi:hypothetical protein
LGGPRLVGKPLTYQENVANRGRLRVEMVRLPSALEFQS